MTRASEQGPTPAVTGSDPLAEREIALVDLLDRLLAGGVVLAGDVTLSIAEVDLVHISLRALITSVRPESTHASTRPKAAEEAQR